MALPNLATSADLSARPNVDVNDSTLVDTMLAVASATVRGAAGSPILQAVSTVTLTAWGDQRLTLPGLPVTAVDSVTVDGTTVTDHRLVDGTHLWRLAGFGSRQDPTDVVVTYTHGLAAVPAHIVDLTCSLAAAGIAAWSGDADTFDPRVVAEKIDDYSVTYTQGGESVATVMELPPGTRRWLRKQFGGGTGLVSHR